MADRYEPAAQLAQRLLDSLEVISPPVADGLIFLLGERLKVCTISLPAELPGLLVRDQPYTYIWLRAEDQRVRRRFTLFHELGHYLLHPGVCYCFAKSLQQRQIEREANRFAVQILMPEDWLRRHVAEYGNRPGELAQRYAVSVTAMKLRLEELGL